MRPSLVLVAIALVALIALIVSTATQSSAGKWHGKVATGADEERTAYTPELGARFLPKKSSPQCAHGKCPSPQACWDYYCRDGPAFRWFPEKCRRRCNTVPGRKISPMSQREICENGLYAVGWERDSHELGCRRTGA